MANSDKNIKITPNISQTAQPNVVFAGQGNVPITLKVLDDAYGTLSFEGSSGQLFSINNNLTSGVIFSVNDVSGVPMIDVDASGLVRLAPLGGTTYSNTLYGVPRTVAGSGNSVTIRAADGLTSGAGGNILLQPGQQATTGGDGRLIVRQPNGTAGTNEVQMWHDGSQFHIKNFTAVADYGTSSSIILKSSNDFGVQIGRISASTVGVYPVGTNTIAIGNPINQTVYAGWWYSNYATGAWEPNNSSYPINWTDVGFYRGSKQQLIVGNSSSGGGSLAYTANTPSALSANTNDLALGGSAFQRLSSSAAYNLTGIAPPSTGAHVDGRVIWLHNVGSFNITLKHSQTSVAGNQFINEGGGDIVLGPNRIVQCTYDGTSTKWRVHGEMYPYNLPTADGTSGQVLSTNGSGTLSWSTAFSGLSGSGTTNYIAKFTGSTTAGNSQIFDNGTNVGIGTTSPGHLLHVTGANENNSTYYSQLRIDGTGTYPQNIAGISLNTSAAVQSHIRFLENGTVKAQIRYNEGSNQTNKLSVYSFISAATVLTLDCSSNNVGIGTYSPNRRLVIAGNAADPQINMYKSPDGTINAAQQIVSLGTGSSQTNSGTTGGNEYGILQLYQSGTVRCQLYAYSGGNFVLDGMSFGSNSTPPSQVYIAAPTAATTALIAKGFTSQTAPLTVWQNSSGAVLDYVSADGNTSITFADMDWTPNYSGGVSSPSSGTFQKTSGNNGQWDAQVYSSEGFTKSAHVTFKASQINAYLMVGLNSDPSTDAVYSSIDYAIYCHADNYIYIYENGAQIGSNYGIYSTSTVLSVVYDGVNVTYYKDGTIIRQVARAVGNALYLDSSFYTLNGAINSVKFGPALPNIGAQGTANYLAKFSTANSLVNSSIQDTGTGVLINSVATPRYYSVSVNAGNAVRLGQWYALEGNVSLMIQVSSDTGSNSGTSTYLYNGGFSVISNTAGQYVKLIPLMIGRGHGDSADSSISSTDAGGWTVFLYTGTTSPAYTMGIAVGVPTGKSNKALRITVTELRGGMTYTADGSSIAYPTTTSPNILQHTYGNVASAGYVSASAYVSSDIYYQTFYRQQYTQRLLPNVVGDYIEICNAPENCDYFEIMAMGYQPGYQHVIKVYKFAATFATMGGTIQPIYQTPNPVTVSDFELEVIRSAAYDGRLRLRRTKGTSNHNVYLHIKYHGPATLTLYSGTGTSSGLTGVTTNQFYLPNTVSALPPVGGSGNGNSLNFYASSGVGTGAGGSIILQPGTQATSGGNGIVVIRQPGGTAGTDEIQISHDGTNGFIEPKDGNLTLRSATGVLRLQNSAGTSTLTVTTTDTTGGGIPVFGGCYQIGFNPSNSIRSYPEHVFGSNARVSASDSGFILANSSTLTFGPGPYTNTARDCGFGRQSVGVITVTNASTGGGSLAFTSSTTNISTATNNLALNGSAFQRLNCTTACDLTGVAPPSGGSHVDGRMIRIINVGTANLTFKHNSGSSTAGNQFYCVDLIDIVLTPRDMVELIYDSMNMGASVAGWRVF